MSEKINIEDIINDAIIDPLEIYRNMTSEEIIKFLQEKVEKAEKKLMEEEGE